MYWLKWTGSSEKDLPKSTASVLLITYICFDDKHTPFVVHGYNEQYQKFELTNLHIGLGLLRDIYRDEWKEIQEKEIPLEILKQAIPIRYYINHQDNIVWKYTNTDQKYFCSFGWKQADNEETITKNSYELISEADALAKIVKIREKYNSHVVEEGCGAWRYYTSFAKSYIWRYKDNVPGEVFNLERDTNFHGGAILERSHNSSPIKLTEIEAYEMIRVALVKRL